MSGVLEDLKTFIVTCPYLATGAIVTVDRLDASPIQYSIKPMPGARTIEEWLNGTKVKSFPFAIEAMFSTEDEFARLSNNLFYEQLAEWFDSKTDSGQLPTLDTKKTATAIEALGQGYAFQHGESGTGVYQALCRLVYEQQP